MIITPEDPTTPIVTSASTPTPATVTTATTTATALTAAAVTAACVARRNKNIVAAGEYH